MVISSFISSILVITLGVWAYMKLESSMNSITENQLLIEPSKMSYKMWKDMPVTMYQSFTFFNLTNWNQVKSVGQKPRFVEVGPYVYRTIWTKSDINFLSDEKLVSFAERKQWIFQAHLSKGSEDDQIWTINTPLMTALALIQNAPVITRNIVSVILDGLGEGAFIKRNIRSLLFEGYSDLIVSVGPLFDRRFANFNGKFAYLYNKNDSVDGIWTVSTGVDDLASLNKITRFQSTIVNMTSFSSGQLPQGLNEVKPECAPAWSLDQSTNGQLFAPFNRGIEEEKLQQQLSLIKMRARQSSEILVKPEPLMVQTSQPSPSKRFFRRSTVHEATNRDHQPHDLVPNPFLNQRNEQSGRQQQHHLASSLSSHQTAGSVDKESQDKPPQLRDVGKYIFYPDLCRPIHLLPGKQEVIAINGIKASRYYIDPRVFMNSSQVPTNRCYEMNPRPALANAIAATLNSVTNAANVAMPGLVTGSSSPFAMFSQPIAHHNHQQHGENVPTSILERSNHASSFLNNAFHTLSGVGLDPQGAGTGANGGPISRLGRVRQLFSNIVSQRMSAGPGSLLPSLTSGPSNLLGGNHFPSANSRNSQEEAYQMPRSSPLRSLHPANQEFARHGNVMDGQPQSSSAIPLQSNSHLAGGSDRWVTQFRLKWPSGVFSIGQCQLGAPIYASLPHFLDADEYYLEQVDGLKPNRSLHEFYIDIESTLHSVPVGAKARLQLNVATPELRFRNIPNAMIPVLWQEVTFEIDKPITTMLYWSFTMSSTIYKVVSVLLIALGAVLMVFSLLTSFRLHTTRVRITKRKSESKLERSEPQESQRSSWSSHRTMPECTINAVTPVSRISSSPYRPNQSHNGCKQHDDTIICHGAALNHGFISCADTQSRLEADTNEHPCPNSTLDCGSVNPSRADGGSIRQVSPGQQSSSRSSSNCELVSSLGTAVNCTGCLLACLRHSTNRNHHNQKGNDQIAGTSDSSIVRPLTSISDLDKTTISSRDSRMDSCGSIYTHRSKNTFK